MTGFTKTLYQKYNHHYYRLDVYGDTDWEKRWSVAICLIGVEEGSMSHTFHPQFYMYYLETDDNENFVKFTNEFFAENEKYFQRSGRTFEQQMYFMKMSPVEQIRLFKELQVL